MDRVLVEKEAAQLYFVNKSGIDAALSCEKDLSLHQAMDLTRNDVNRSLFTR
jgi:hypothetical protein